MLVRGLLYLPRHQKASGHPYYLSEKYLYGGISISNHYFDDVLLKYNIEIDRLILHTDLIDGAPVNIVLNSQTIDSFNIQGRHFINTRILLGKDTLSRFFERIYSNGFSLIVRHYKEFRADYNDKTPHGRFTSNKPRLYLLNQGKLTAVSKKSSLLKYFIAYKKEIKKYIKQNKIKYKRANQWELKKLMKFCHDITSK